MTQEELIIWCEKQAANSDYLEIPESVFLSLSADDAKVIAAYFGNNKLIRLPVREIQFFEWLKAEDAEVWDDLWKDLLHEPYRVSISFLPLLTDKLTGFPICDLLRTDNFYFTNDHIADSEAEIFTESSKQRFSEKESLTVSQALMLQISIQPTDIWHFAFHFKIDLKMAKETALQLVEDKMLIHFKEAKHLASFIRF